MESYFFVPADDKYKVEKAIALRPDVIIADLEDGIAEDNFDQAVNNVLFYKDSIDIVRINTNKLFDGSRIYDVFRDFGSVIYPKVSSEADFTQMVDLASSFKLSIILLVETPWLLMKLHRIDLGKFPFIKGIAFGSHDYSSEMDVKIDSFSVYSARANCATIARAGGLKSIDIASMEVINKERFLQECNDGNKLGVDGKFVIHPRQLEWLLSFSPFTEHEIKWAEKIVSVFSERGDRSGAVLLDGKVVERPHLLKALKIISKNKSDEE